MKDISDEARRMPGPRPRAAERKRELGLVSVTGHVSKERRRPFRRLYEIRKKKEKKLCHRHKADEELLRAA